MGAISIRKKTFNNPCRSSVLILIVTGLNERPTDQKVDGESPFGLNALYSKNIAGLFLRVAFVGHVSLRCLLMLLERQF